MPFSWTWLRSLFVGSSEDNDSHHHHAAVTAAVQANPQQATAAGAPTDSAIRPPHARPPTRKRKQVQDNTTDDNAVPKRARTTSKARSGGMAPLLASILKPLVFSGHIGAVQVGRLAQVCKDVNKEAMDEQVWANLCRRDYPSFSTAGEARSLYKRCSAPSASRSLPLVALPPLGPPRFTVNDIHLPLTIKYKGSVIFWGIVRGPDCKAFVEHGALRIVLSKPIILGRAQWDFFPEELQRYKRGGMGRIEVNGLRAVCSNGLDRRDFKVTLHVVRGTYENIICVFRSGDRKIEHFNSSFVHPLIDDGKVANFDLSKEQRYQPFIYRRPLSWEQEPPSWEQFHFGTSATAYAIVNRLPYPVHFGATLNFGVVEGGDFGLVDCVIEVLRHDLRHFKGENGVTLLHILSSIEQT